MNIRLRRVTLFFWLLPALWLSAVGTVLAAETDAPPADGAATSRALRVGVKITPPFVILQEDGTLGGITIGLWRGIAERLGVRFEFARMALPELLEAVEQGQVDVAAAALTVTAEREARMDFSHPFFHTGFGIAVPRRAEESILSSVLASIFSWAFLKALATLALVLLGAGLLVWFFERRRNPAQFGGRALKGIGSGFWWSAVTMTTVGYGDKAPVTLGGRLVAIVWMFTGIITISTFTATITSALTVSTFQDALVRGPTDLPRARVGSVRGATSEAFLKQRGIRVRAFEAPSEALLALSDGHLDAVVHDAPMLRQLIRDQLSDTVEILPGRFERQEYALAFPSGSALREPVNRALLEMGSGAEWREILLNHLGGDADGWSN